MTLKISKIINNLIETGCVISIIQFGSSIRKNKYKDIDLAVIVKQNYYSEFIKKIYGKSFTGFDISAIREEEIKKHNKFKFGNHGAHFAYSLKNGKVLYGDNLFSKFLINDKQIRNSILTRLYDYMYDVRKSVFKNEIQKSIKERWPKFLRLSLYLLDSNLKYPEILDLTENELSPYLKEHKLSLPKNNLILAHEIIWEKVLIKNKII